jgi:hypothetical protein
LKDHQVERNMATAFHLVMEMLGQPEGIARRLDPSGEVALRLARRLRREAGRTAAGGDVARMTDVVDQYFGLPAYDLTFWASSNAQRPWETLASAAKPTGTA